MRGSNRRFGAARVLPAALLLALASLTTACAPDRAGEGPAVLETEDVGPAPDDELDLSTDRKAAPRAATSGQLPRSFPEGLPVYKPSTISDVGQGETEDFVQLMSQHDAAKIGAWYQGALDRAGWSVESGPGGSLVATRGRYRARISIQTSGPVTLVRIAY